MLNISATDEWRSAHPGAAIGLLEISGAVNTGASPQLDDRKRETEARLRERYAEFTRQDFLSLPVMASYVQYYKRFSKTYHVLQQVESIALKAKSLPNVSPLVDSNFAAEVDTLILTAGHDVAQLRGSILMDVSREEDRIIQMNGAAKIIRAGDMIMRDAEDTCCSIIYGQDNRSPISPETTRVLYVAYVPPGIPAETVNAQLQKIEENIRLFSPAAVVERCQVLSA